MATSHTRRITRKELRQPDRFQVATEQALEFYQSHKNLVFAAIGGLVLIGIIILGWQLFKERQNTAAAHEFTNATELYQSEKYREALPAFEKVQAYRWSLYAGLAHLYTANSHIALGELDKALSSAQRAVTASRPNTLYRQLALMTLANAAEQKNDCRQAIESLQRSSQDRRSAASRSLARQSALSGEDWRHGRGVNRLQGICEGPTGFDYERQSCRT